MTGGSAARTTTGVLVALAASAVALGAAPALLPETYSWVAHTTSEAAGQGVAGAWLPRTGFVLLGLAVFTLAATTRQRWGAVGAGCHAAFGVAMVAAPGVAGALQRAMFAIAYLYYAVEARALTAQASSSSVQVAGSVSGRRPL